MQYVERIDELGEQLFEQIYERDMEGIVAKPKVSLYREVRGKARGSRSRILTIHRRRVGGRCFRAMERGFLKKGYYY